MRREEGRALPLGITIENNRVNFAVSIEPQDTCILCLYKYQEEIPSYTLEMKTSEGIPGIRHMEIIDLENEIVEYEYLVNGESFLDPYVREVSGRRIWGNEKKTNVRGRVLSEIIEKEDNMPHIPEHDIIAYRLHVRGFTKHASAKSKWSGTFKGLKDKIPYFKDLGVNQIQLLPSFEFIEEGLKLNYWGYTYGFHMALKSAYSYEDSVCEEFKNMVHEFHANGMEVVLDMPFIGVSSFMYQIECLRFYVLHYHVDGFVLNPYVSNTSEIKKDPVLGYVKLLIQKDEFQNTMRKFLKGDEGMVKEVIWNLKKRSDMQEETVYNHITNHNGFTMSDLVSYDGKHNELNGERNRDGNEYNYCWNCGVEGKTRKKVVTELRKKQVRNAWALLMLAQGTPCILAGDEFGNSQSGNNNAYCQDNEISWIDWRLKTRNKELHQFVQSLIKLRKSYSVLHQPTLLQGMDSKACGIPDVSYHGSEAWITPDEIASRKLGVLYSGRGLGEADCYIAYNMHWMEHEFALPTIDKNKSWYKVLDTSNGDIGIEEKVENQRSVEVEERSISMFVCK